MKFSGVYLLLILLLSSCGKSNGSSSTQSSSEETARKFNPAMRSEMNKIGSFINNQKDSYSKGYRGSLDDYQFPEDTFKGIDLSKYHLAAVKGDKPDEIDPRGFISEKLNPDLNEIFVLTNNYSFVRLQGSFKSNEEINKALAYKPWNKVEKAKLLLKNVGLTATDHIRYSENGSAMKSCYVSKEDKNLTYAVELEFYGASQLRLTLSGENTDKLIKAVEELLNQTIKIPVPEKITEAIKNKKSASVWTKNSGLSVKIKNTFLVFTFHTRPQTF